MRHKKNMLQMISNICFDETLAHDCYFLIFNGLFQHMFPWLSTKKCLYNTNAFKKKVFHYVELIII